MFAGRGDPPERGESKNAKVWTCPPPPPKKKQVIIGASPFRTILHFANSISHCRATPSIMQEAHSECKQFFFYFWSGGGRKSCPRFDDAVKWPNLGFERSMHSLWWTNRVINFSVIDFAGAKYSYSVRVSITSSGPWQVAETRIWGCEA